MIRKTFKAGHSIVISIPRQAREALGIHKGTKVSVELDRQRRQIVIAPMGVRTTIAAVDKDFALQLKDFIEQYRSDLETLAK